MSANHLRLSITADIALSITADIALLWQHVSSANLQSALQQTSAMKQHCAKLLNMLDDWLIVHRSI
jgi:hypothetical protein